MCCPAIWKSISLLVLVVAVAVGFQQLNSGSNVSSLLAVETDSRQDSQSSATSDKQEESVQEADGVDPAVRQKQIEELGKYLERTKWVGTFTVRGTDKFTEEEYEILSAEKDEEGDMWVLMTRIKYNKKDVKVPIGLEIKWAGDTPVITAQDLTIPLMGTFNARVLINEGQYAGTWAHGEVGGHLFGRITKMDEPEQDEAAESKEK